jgi:hypothetical protein
LSDLSIQPFTAMKLNIFYLRNLFSGLGIVGMIALLAPPTVLAQSVGSSEEIRNWQQNQSSDDLNNVFNNSEGGVGGGLGSLTNLINRLQSADPRSPSELSTEQQQNINSEAAAFRNRQQQQQQLQIVPVNGATTPSPQ